MSPRMWVFWGAVLGGLGVTLGAFGAHGLPGWLEALGYGGENLLRRIANFETAVRYQMLHALALVLLGALLSQNKNSTLWQWAGRAWLLGVLIFSGLLYALVFVGPNFRWLGAIVPVGGVSLIAGWILLAAGALAIERQEADGR